MALAIAPIKCTEVSNTNCTCKKGHTKRWKWAHTTYKFVLHDKLGCSYTHLEENQESDGDLGAIKHSVILIDCTCTWLLKYKVVKKSRWCGWFGSYHIDRLLKSNREQIGGISFEEPCSPARHRIRYHRYSHMHNQCDACGIITASNCNRKPTLLGILQFCYCLLQFVWRCLYPGARNETA